MSNIILSTSLCTNVLIPSCTFLRSSRYFLGFRRIDEAKCIRWVNQWPGCIGGHVFPSIHLWPIGFSSPWIDMIWCLKLWALVKRNAVAFEVFFGFLKVCEEGGCLGIHFLKDESLEWMIRFLSIFSRK